MIFALPIQTIKSKSVNNVLDRISPDKTKWQCNVNVKDYRMDVMNLNWPIGSLLFTVGFIRKSSYENCYAFRFNFVSSHVGDRKSVAKMVNTPASVGTIHLRFTGAIEKYTVFLRFGYGHNLQWWQKWVNLFWQQQQRKNDPDSCGQFTILQLWAIRLEFIGGLVQFAFFFLIDVSHRKHFSPNSHRDSDILCMQWPAAKLEPINSIRQSDRTKWKNEYHLRWPCRISLNLGKDQVSDFERIWFFSHLVFVCVAAIVCMTCRCKSFAGYRFLISRGILCRQWKWKCLAIVLCARMLYLIFPISMNLSVFTKNETIWQAEKENNTCIEPRKRYADAERQLSSWCRRGNTVHSFR